MKVLLVLFGTYAFIIKRAFPSPMESSTTKYHILLFIKSLVTSSYGISRIILSVQFERRPGRNILLCVIYLMDVFIESAWAKSSTRTIQILEI